MIAKRREIWCETQSKTIAATVEFLNKRLPENVISVSEIKFTDSVNFIAVIWYWEDAK